MEINAAIAPNPSLALVGILSDAEIEELFIANCYTDDYGNCLMGLEDFRDGVRAALLRSL